MEKEKKGKYVAFYIRVSSKGQATDGYGADLQISICQKIAERMGWTHYGTYHDTEGVSGDVIAKHRPEFMKMLGDGKNKKFKIVVVAHMDRLGRKGVVMEKALDMIFETGLKIYVNCMFIENTLMGRLLAGIQGQLAQYDKGQILERMKEGMERLTLEKGEKRGKLPYGYRRLGKRKNLEIEIVKEEAEIIRSIYEQRKKGRSQQKIADVLNEKGLMPSKTTSWSQRTVSRILSPERKEIYQGGIRNGYNQLGIRWPQIIEDDECEADENNRKWCEMIEDVIKFDMKYGNLPELKDPSLVLPPLILPLSE